MPHTFEQSRYTAHIRTKQPPKSVLMSCGHLIILVHYRIYTPEVYTFIGLVNVDVVVAFAAG